MPVTDHQVDALRSYLSGDVEEHKRLISQFDQDADPSGWSALVAAAFFETVERRFTGASDDVVEFVGSVRARSDKLADEVDPSIAEGLILYVLDEAPLPDVDSSSRLLIQSLLLASIVHDNQYDRELDQLLARAREIADQWLD